MTDLERQALREAKIQMVAAAEDIAIGGDLSGAARAARQALDLDPDDAELIFLWGYYLAAAGDRELAMAILERVIVQDPAHEGARQALAELAPLPAPAMTEPSDSRGVPEFDLGELEVDLPGLEGLPPLNLGP